MQRATVSDVANSCEQEGIEPPRVALANVRFQGKADMVF
jgi:hypothetical protein